MTRLEHVNMTVPDPKQTAAVLQSLFGWEIRWQGAALNGGFTVHVGEPGSYLALYAPKEALSPEPPRYTYEAGLNHIGLEVEDLAAMEQKVRDLGYTPHNHQDYEPGKRFYFDGPDGVEYELVEYA